MARSTDRKNLSDLVDAASSLLTDLQRAMHPAQVTSTLLAGIWLELRKVASGAGVGHHDFRITPYQLTLTPQRILEKESEGRLRRVSVVVDSALDMDVAPPSLRIGTQGGVTGDAGGVRVSPGTTFELGEVHAGTALYAASSEPINIYVIERV